MFDDSRQLLDLRRLVVEQRGPLGEFGQVGQLGRDVCDSTVDGFGGFSKLRDRELGLGRETESRIGSKQTEDEGQISNNKKKKFTSHRGSGGHGRDARGNQGRRGRGLCLQAQRLGKRKELLCPISWLRGHS